MLANTPSRRVKSVETAFELIDRLLALGGATPAQLTDEIDLSKSSVHNYLATLEMAGYVVNDGGRYRLGLRFLTNGTAAKQMVNVELPIVETLRETAEALAHPTWWIAEELGRGYFVESAAPGEKKSVYGSIGKRSYLHAHAPGKAILAQSSEEYAELIAQHHGLPKQTNQTTTDLEALQTELEAIRDQGFAISEGESVLGIFSVGAAFEDGQGRMHALGVFENSRTFAGSQPETIGQRLVECVDNLERRVQEVN